MAHAYSEWFGCFSKNHPKASDCATLAFITYATTHLNDIYLVKKYYILRYINDV